MSQSDPPFDFSLFHDLPDDTEDEEEGDEDDDEDLSDKEDSNPETCATCGSPCKKRKISDIVFYCSKVDTKCLRQLRASDCLQHCLLSSLVISRKVVRLRAALLAFVPCFLSSLLSVSTFRTAAFHHVSRIEDLPS